MNNGGKLEFQNIYNELYILLKEYEANLDVKTDSLENYYLDTRKIDPKNKKPIFFGAVQIKKNYVSYHLMPVYIFPELLNDTSDDMKKRMQGKSCFNFKKAVPILFSELKQLTKNGFDKYKEQSFL
ncbi:hypothetical protein [Bacillus sp. FJAT-45350]|uniref:hypothetical protein n=1 Tax=Bacillus sp. FJAT-45350 TaxID=2011014 RepID=UPI000BB6BC39|nr:hypothetical protein [Bacillus sp. FJAT-45350]